MVGKRYLKEWSPELYEELENPNEKLSVGSNKKVWWVCKKSGGIHRWTTTVDKRFNRGQGCPYCSRRSPWPGETDLGTENPSLADELVDQSLRTKLMVGSQVAVYWVCRMGHGSWEALVMNRALRGKGCPMCSGHSPIPGETDLATTHPELAAELVGTDPTTVKRGTNRKVMWRCPEGHKDYPSVVRSRAVAGTGCPTCAKGQQRSKAELEIESYVQSIYSGEILTSNRSVLGTRELDIYLPDLKIGIEFNGIYYHSEKFLAKSYHRDKLELCASKGIRLITIWEDDWRDRRDDVKSMLEGVLTETLPGVVGWDLASVSEPECWYIVRGSRVTVPEYSGALRIWGHGVPEYTTKE